MLQIPRCRKTRFKESSLIAGNVSNSSPNEKNQCVFRFPRVVSISSSNQQMHFFISLVFVLTVFSDFFLLFFLIGCKFFSGNINITLG